jgi:outer membrane protein assembly factor BamB
MMRRRSILALALFTSVTTLAAADRNWPQFRGLQGGVADDDPALPERWSQTENVRWKVDIPGRGWSSPVVYGDHVFITSAINTKTPVEEFKPVPTYTARSLGGPMTGADVATSGDEHRWVLYDVDLKSGKIRWQRDVHSGVPSQSVHQKNTYASETVVTDGERVFVYLGYAGLFAFDMSGKPLWSKSLGPFKTRLGWGAASSPAIHNGRVYIVSDNDEQSFVAAYDAKSGKELWRQTRDEATNWSTPFVWVNDLRTEIVTTGTRKARSYDVDGKLLWEVSGFTSIHVPTPIARDGLLYISSGYVPDTPKPVYAIRPGASGDITPKEGAPVDPHIVWSSSTLGSFHPSPLVVGGTYYTLLDRGFMTANDAKTGKEVYARQRVSAESSSFTASPWSYNGRIFALSEDGDTFVVQAGADFKVLGKNSLGEMALATPAVAQGNLFIRTATKLYRIGK